jgi:hypothetical protein
VVSQCAGTLCIEDEMMLQNKHVPYRIVSYRSFCLCADDAAVSAGPDMGAGADAQMQQEPPMSDGNKTQHSDKRRRVCKTQRSRLQDPDSDSDAHDDDKYSQEMLQKRLKTLTDEKEIKRLKR